MKKSDLKLQIMTTREELDAYKQGFNDASKAWSAWWNEVAKQRASQSRHRLFVASCIIAALTCSFVIAALIIK